MANVRAYINLIQTSPDHSVDGIHTNETSNINITIQRNLVPIAGSSNPLYYYDKPIAISMSYSLYGYADPEYTQGNIVRLAYPYYNPSITTNLDASFDTDPNGHSNFYVFDRGESEFYTMAEGVMQQDITVKPSDLYGTSGSSTRQNGYIIPSSPLSHYINLYTNLGMPYFRIRPFFKAKFDCTPLAGDTLLPSYKLGPYTNMEPGWNGQDSLPSITLNPVDDIFIGQKLDMSWTTSDGTS